MTPEIKSKVYWQLRKNLTSVTPVPAKGGEVVDTIAMYSVDLHPIPWKVAIPPKIMDFRLEIEGLILDSPDKLFSNEGGPLWFLRYNAKGEIWIDDNAHKVYLYALGHLLNLISPVYEQPLHQPDGAPTIEGLLQYCVRIHLNNFEYFS